MQNGASACIRLIQTLFALCRENIDESAHAWKTLCGGKFEITQERFLHFKAIFVRLISPINAFCHKFVNFKHKGSYLRALLWFVLIYFAEFSVKSAAYAGEADLAIIRILLCVCFSKNRHLVQFFTFVSKLSKFNMPIY